MENWSVFIWKASWQGGLLCCLVGFCLFLFNKLSHRFQSWLWRLVALKFLVTLFCLPLELPLLAPTVQTSSLETTNVEKRTLTTIATPAPTETTDLLSSGWIFLFAGWSLIVAWKSIVFVLDAKKTNTKVRKAELVVDAESLLLLNKMANKLKLNRIPRLLETNDFGSPWATGIFFPKIILPRQTFQHFTTSEKELVLAHELAHLRRGDLFWTLLLTLVEVLFFFHPCVWWLARRLRISQEIATDELALQASQQEVLTYGTLLVSIVEKIGSEKFNPTLVVGATGPNYSVTRRLIAMKWMTEVTVWQQRMFAFSMGLLFLFAILPWKLVAGESPPKNEQIKSHEGKANDNAQQATHVAQITVKHTSLEGEVKSELKMNTKISFLPCENFKVSLGDFEVNQKKYSYDFEIHTSRTTGKQQHMIATKISEQVKGKKPSIVTAPKMIIQEDPTTRAAMGTIAIGSDIPIAKTKNTQEVESVFEGVEIQITIHKEKQK